MNANENSVEELAERYLLWLRNIAHDSPTELMFQCRNESQRQQLQQRMEEIDELFELLIRYQNQALYQGTHHGTRANRYLVASS